MPWPGFSRYETGTRWYEYEYCTVGNVVDFSFNVVSLYVSDVFNVTIRWYEYYCGFHWILCAFGFSAAIKCRLVGSNCVPSRILHESRSEARRKRNRRL